MKFSVNLTQLLLCVAVLTVAFPGPVRAQWKSKDVSLFRCSYYANILADYGRSLYCGGCMRIRVDQNRENRTTIVKCLECMQGTLNSEESELVFEASTMSQTFTKACVYKSSFRVTKFKALFTKTN